MKDYLLSEIKEICKNNYHGNGCGECELFSFCSNNFDFLPIQWHVEPRDMREKKVKEGKEIEELTEILSDDYCKLFDDGQGQDCSCECDNCRANRVVEAGYRNAKEILQDVWNSLGDGAENDKIIISLFKKYGIEID